MKTQIFRLLMILLVPVWISCGDDARETRIETEEIQFRKDGEMQLLKEGNVTQTVDIEIADTPYEWETGLMYRQSMEDHQGMLFVYPTEAPRSFYMKNTHIPLDLIFYNRDSTVISYYENARPMDETNIPSNGPAQFILELNAGKVAEWNIETGDRMRYTRD